MKIMYIAAECKPFSMAGGVADVAGELPIALKKQGVDIDPDPDLNEIGMREYTETLKFENAFKIEMFTPAPSGFGAYYCFQQTK